MKINEYLFNEYKVLTNKYIAASQHLRELLPRFKVWSDSLAARLGGMVSPEEARDIAMAVREYQEYILEVIADRRAQPKDDMISDLANAEIDDGRKLTDAEVISIVQQFLVAGNETTTSSLAGGLLSLIVMCFYLTRTSNYNYGGKSVALRWMLWLTPFWVLSLIPALRMIGKSRTLRFVSLLLLAASTYSVASTNTSGTSAW